MCGQSDFLNTLSSNPMRHVARFAVFGLLDELTSSSVRAIQRQLGAFTGNQTVLHFPVHITIRGRFWAEPHVAVSAFHSFVETRQLALDSLSLSGPVFHPPDLAWLEIQRESAAFRKLAEVHHHAEAALLSIILKDEVNPQHSGNGYLPHVTLGWGCRKEVLEDTPGLNAELKMSASLRCFALVGYPEGWSVSEDLIIVEAAS